MSKPNTLTERITAALRQDTDKLNPRLHGLGLLTRLIPATVGNQMRTELYRRIGFRIGDRTVIRGSPDINSGKQPFENLIIGSDCFIDVDCTFDLEERITLEDGVTLGHQVMILTSTHELGPKEHRAGPITRAPVTVKSGAWLGPRSMILPGVTIGEGAIITAGSLVNKDVAPHTRVAGAPAKVIETMEPAS